MEGENIARRSVGPRTIRCSKLTDEVLNILNTQKIIFRVVH